MAVRAPELPSGVRMKTPQAFIVANYFTGGVSSVMRGALNDAKVKLALGNDF